MTIPATLFVLFLAGCASTTINSQRNPQEASRTFNRVLVLVNVRDFALQQEAELIFRARSAGHSTQLVPYHTLFFAGKAYSPSETATILANAGIDAVLWITPAGEGTVSAYVPKTTTGSGSIAVEDDGASGSFGSTTRGGYSVSAPTGHFRAELHDRTTGKSVWMAVMRTGPQDAMSTAYGGLTWKDIYKSMARKTVDQLFRDRIIR